MKKYLIFAVLLFVCGTAWSAGDKKTAFTDGGAINVKAIQKVKVPAVSSKFLDWGEKSFEYDSRYGYPSSSEADSSMRLTMERFQNAGLKVTKAEVTGGRNPGFVINYMARKPFDIQVYQGMIYDSNEAAGSGMIKACMGLQNKRVLVIESSVRDVGMPDQCTPAKIAAGGPALKAACEAWKTKKNFEIIYSAGDMVQSRLWHSNIFSTSADAERDMLATAEKLTSEGNIVLETQVNLLQNTANQFKHYISYIPR